MDCIIIDVFCKGELSEFRINQLTDYLDCTKVFMQGNNPRHKDASGVDSDSLRKKIAHPTSEERPIYKQIKADLKYGMSKESPFLKGKAYELTHPSTKIIFGEPEKRVRPYTSKVNSLLRNTLLESRNKPKASKNPDPAFKNSFSQFANCSMSVEKQKLISFYSSASTMKGLRDKIAKGMI